MLETNENYTLKSNFSDKIYKMSNFSKHIDGTLRFFANDGAVSIKLVSLHDRSALELFDYDSNCAPCYLNIAHSKEYHKTRVVK